MCAAADTATTIVDEISLPIVTSLLSIHPNDVTICDIQGLPSAWSPWWAWASDYAQPTPAWLRLVHYFTRPSDDDQLEFGIPPELSALIDAVRKLQLQRTPAAYETRSAGHCGYRISRKKEHEVNRMSSYIHHLVHSEQPQSVWHAVDVGSGQGYLSRALQELDFHVLALDNDKNQTSGANRWTTPKAWRRLKRKRRSDSPNGTREGLLTHRTVHVCPRTLEDAIVDWLSDPPGSRQPDDPPLPPMRPQPLPVLMVALHACGSLTVDVLRTFLSGRTRMPHAGGAEYAWRPHSLVVVGCCYNLMSPADFPLSKPLRDMNPTPRLTIAALHLAAQVPSQWLQSEDTRRGAELALRKVVYRALLHPILQEATTKLDVTADRATLPERPVRPGLGETFENRRLGRLNDSAYEDWPMFLERATSKLGIDLAGVSMSLPGWFTNEAARLEMESALFALQTLRCILGPLIEALILLDRHDWIKQELAEMNDGGQEVEVKMVNLFDQATGSGRNVALVIKPATIPQRV